MESCATTESTSSTVRVLPYTMRLCAGQAAAQAMVSQLAQCVQSMERAPFSARMEPYGQAGMQKSHLDGEMHRPGLKAICGCGC